MRNGTKIIIAAALIGGAIFAYLKWFKNKPVPPAIIDNGIPVKKVLTTRPVVNNAPTADGNATFEQQVAASRPIIVPEIPKKYPDGKAVPDSVLNDPEYIKAWQNFYRNTIFPPGDIRNTLTPSGGMWIGDGMGGFYDPNA